MGKLFFDLAGEPTPEQTDILLKITDAELSKRNWLEKIYVDNAANLRLTKLLAEFMSAAQFITPPQIGAITLWRTGGRLPVKILPLPPVLATPLLKF